MKHWFEEWSDSFMKDNISTVEQTKLFYEKIANKLVPIFALVDGNELVGTIRPDYRYGYFSCLFVVPKYRNIGCGKKLIQFVEKEFLAHGIDISTLQCENKLVPYYIKNGYSPTNNPSNKAFDRFCNKKDITLFQKKV